MPDVEVKSSCKHLQTEIVPRLEGRVLSRLGRLVHLDWEIKFTSCISKEDSFQDPSWMLKPKDAQGPYIKQHSVYI